MEVDAREKQLLNRYLQLLQRWNKVYNLTAVRDPAEMQSLHIADSLSVAPYLRGTTCLDVGSGAGLPGIPLAIIQPQRQFTLLDTNGKKTRFMQQAVLELGLSNVTVIQTRVESWQPVRCFDAIISRAFASLQDFVTFTGKHACENGILYAMKGRYPDSELAELPSGWQVMAQHTLHVPDLDAERHLLELQHV
ncbi:16S rRNA (guanine(527)-N(7))-methyltransferase RsmG [Thiothrix winogradskyi]|uniref:Ribosomal RNA small subunit methyltransferase G n=1 Tax=Thiothrix winogradskyi TaxID=96472 RepID=A0ABY3T3M2_9GAMM|nr:16S rRNA (guanine(527)-N(7))-methyltransferase RsmG [Thiothrix winogradskyi]UJS25872.1 16S rRNA (guanine(527)-N(7))-methyltransferase RsmG [Thiothrix winogradskyi]